MRLSTFSNAPSRAALGDANPLSLISSLYSTVEFRSRVTPNIVLNTADVTGGSPSFVGPLIQPALIADGPAGHQEIAPYGVPSPYTGWFVAAGIFGTVFGLGWLFGKL